MHILVTRRLRGIVDESLVHSNPVTVYCFFVSVFFFDFIFLSIYLFKDINHNHFQTIWVAEYHFNDSKQCY